MGVGWWCRCWVVVVMVVVAGDWLEDIHGKYCKVDEDCRASWPALCGPSFPCLCVPAGGETAKKCMLKAKLGYPCRYDGQCVARDYKMVCRYGKCFPARERLREDGRGNTRDSSLQTSPRPPLPTTVPPRPTTVPPLQDESGLSVGDMVGYGVYVCVVIFLIFVVVAGCTRYCMLRSRPRPPPPLPLPTRSSDPPPERRRVIREPSEPPPPYAALPPPSYEEVMAVEGCRHSFNGGEIGSFGMGKGGEEGYGILPSAPLIASTSIMQPPCSPPPPTAPSYQLIHSSSPSMPPKE